MSQHKSMLNKGLLMLMFSVSGMGIRFLSNLMLAWMLMPEMFGVAAIVTTIIVGLQMLSDVGIYDSVIRNEKGEDKQFCSTAWLMQIGRGFVLYLLIVIAAPYLAAFYHTPELATYLYVAGIALPLIGFKSIYMTVLQRRMDVLPELKLDFTAQIIATLGTLVVAYLTGSVWSLIVAHVINGVTLSVGSHLITPRAFYSFRFVKEYSWQILSFGKWIFFGTMSTFLIQNVDKLMLGKIGSLSELGVYQIAFAFATIFYTASGMMMHKLVYPALAEASRDNQAEFHKTMTDLKKVLLPVITALLFISYFAAPYFFTYLYPEAYHDASWISQFMLLMIWFMVLSDFHAAVFVAHNEPKVTAMTSLSVVAARVLLSLFGYFMTGLPGFILGMAAGSMVGYLIYKVLLRQRQGYANHYEIGLTLLSLGFYLAYVVSSEFFAPAELGQIMLSALFVGVMAMTLLVYYKKVVGTGKLPIASAG